MRLELYQGLKDLLLTWNFNSFWSDTLARIAIGAAAILLAWLLWFLTVKIVYRILENIVLRTKASWDDELLNRRIFHRLAWLMPAVVLRYLSPIFLDGLDNILNFVISVVELVMIASITLAIIAFLNFLNDVYSRRRDSARRPIKGIVQAVQVLFIVSAVLVAFSYLTDRPISGLLAGLGAVSAVLMLVFRDPLMGLVAGFQISSNDMVRIGDWIEMPSHGADGDVVDISLLNVTVRNWDKTYVTLPIQSLTTGAFKNWRGMTDAAGRRIKRSLSIDLSTIRFLDDDDIAKLGSISLLSTYLEQRQSEIRAYNSENRVDRGASPVNGRGLTNIGVFRAYAFAYLRSHPKVRSEMTLLVRQLQSGPEGLPIEIYLFTNDTVWANYEDIQSDIFDHLFAVLGEFGLKAFQNPSGSDWNTMGESIRGTPGS